MAYGVGACFGALIGGALARPAKNYKNLFSEDSFFGKFPYLPPSIFSGIIIAIGTVLGYIYIRDSNQDGKFDDENEYVSNQ